MRQHWVNAGLFNLAWPMSHTVTSNIWVVFDLVCECSHRSFILLLSKEKQKNIAQL